MPRSAALGQSSLTERPGATKRVRAYAKPTDRGAEAVVAVGGAGLAERAAAEAAGSMAFRTGRWHGVYKCIRRERDAIGASTTLTVRLPPEVRERLGELAGRTRRTRSLLAGEAIADYVARELEIVDAIERGLDDARAGRVVRHEDAVRRIRATIARAAEDADD